MRRSPEQVLRKHAVERLRQRSIASRDMEQTLTLVRDEAEPRMSPAEWNDSCLLLIGVPAKVLDMLGFYYAAWIEGPRQAIEVSPPPRWSSGPGDTGASAYLEAGMPKKDEMTVTRIAVALTLQQAAARAGWTLEEIAGVTRAKGEALMTVAENLARRGDG